MKAELIKDGLDEELVAGLTRSDVLSAVQMAIWAYANIDDETFNFDNVTHYGGTLRINGHPYVPYTVHDYSNEIWTWYSSKASYRTFDSRAEERINLLTQHLCALEGKIPTKEQTVISEASVVKATLISYEEEIYNISLSVKLNGGGDHRDNLDISAITYTENADGTINITESIIQKAENNNDLYSINVRAKEGDKIKVTIDGDQYLSKGAYFYSPKGGREVSQALVGVCEGETPVKAFEIITFTPDILTPEEDVEGDGQGKSKHYIVFGKTEKIGWYSVSLDGGESFITVFGNDHLEVERGTEIIVKANDIFGDPFTFYVNGEVAKPDDEGYIRIPINNFTLIGALGIPVEAPDFEESVSLIRKIINFFKDLFENIGKFFERVGEFFE